MIAVDSSSLISYLQGQKGDDTRKVHIAFESQSLILPPVVIAEVLSDLNLSQEVVRLIMGIDVIKIRSGYWQRAGRIRGQLLGKGFKARLADTLIAQSCIDHKVPLITRDKDFRHFAKHCGLKLA